MFEDDRLTVICWAKTTDSAITFYLESFAFHLSKHTPVWVLDLHNEAAISKAFSLLASGRIGRWISVANVGFLSKYLSENGTKPTAEILEKCKVRVISVGYDWDLEMIPELPYGALYTQFTQSLLGPARAFMKDGIAVGRLAHAANPAVALDWAERDIDVLFAGNLYRTPDEIRLSWRDQDPKFRESLENALEAWRTVTNKYDETPFQAVLAALTPIYGDVVPAMAFTKALYSLDELIRAEARFDLVKQLKKSKVTIVGAGWDRFDTPNLNLLGKRTQTEAVELMRRSRMVLNLSAPYFASHERVFFGMAMQVAVGTYGRNFLENAGDPPSDEPIIYLQPETLDEVIADRISKNSQLRDLTITAHSRFLANHTWEARAKILYDYIDLTTKSLPIPE